jgi:acetolactate synthase-1/2/3 large subunit
VPHSDGLLHPVQELVGDIDAALAALLPLLTPGNGWRPDEIAAFRQRQRPAIPASSTRLLPGAALKIMQQLLPEDTILTTDAGQHKVYASRLWQCQRSLGYLTSSGLGTMGVAIPIAIAAKLVRPQQPVVALTGDGGFLMRVSELETVRREQVPMVIVIFNDGYLNLIKMKQERQGYAVLGSQFAPVDYARVAEGFGFSAACVDTEAAMSEALQQALASGDPWVIDARIDPEGYI